MNITMEVARAQHTAETVQDLSPYTAFIEADPPVPFTLSAEALQDPDTLFPALLGHLEYQFRQEGPRLRSAVESLLGALDQTEEFQGADRDIRRERIARALYTIVTAYPREPADMQGTGEFSKPWGGSERDPRGHFLTPEGVISAISFAALGLDVPDLTGLDSKRRKREIDRRASLVEHTIVSVRSFPYDRPEIVGAFIGACNAYNYYYRAIMDQARESAVDPTLYPTAKRGAVDDRIILQLFHLLGTNADTATPAFLTGISLDLQEQIANNQAAGEITERSVRTAGGALLRIYPFIEAAYWYQNLKTKIENLAFYILDPTNFRLLVKEFAQAYPACPTYEMRRAVSWNHLHHLRNAFMEGGYPIEGGTARGKGPAAQARKQSDRDYYQASGTACRRLGAPLLGSILETLAGLNPTTIEQFYTLAAEYIDVRSWDGLGVTLYPQLPPKLSEKVSQAALTPVSEEENLAIAAELNEFYRGFLPILIANGYIPIRINTEYASIPYYRAQHLVVGVLPEDMRVDPDEVLQDPQQYIKILRRCTECVEIKLIPEVVARWHPADHECYKRGVTSLPPPMLFLLSAHHNLSPRDRLLMMERFTGTVKVRLGTEVIEIKSDETGPTQVVGTSYVVGNTVADYLYLGIQSHNKTAGQSTISLPELLRDESLRVEAEGLPVRDIYLTLALPVTAGTVYAETAELSTGTASAQAQEKTTEIRVRKREEPTIAKVLKDSPEITELLAERLEGRKGDPGLLGGLLAVTARMHWAAARELIEEIALETAHYAQAQRDPSLSNKVAQQAREVNERLPPYPWVPPIERALTYFSESYEALAA